MSHRTRIDRRGMLGGMAGLCAATAIAPLPFGSRALAATPARTLTVGTRILEVQGRPATVFGILDENGRSGLDLVRSEGFHVSLRNATADPTIVHWHGLTPPFALDGSPLSQTPILPGGSADYAFDLARAGTNWMHSHLGLQEQMLLAAPLIVREGSGSAADRQEIVILLHDFSFTPPGEILARLVSGMSGPVGSGMAAMDMGMMRAPAGGMDHGAMPGMGHDGMGMRPGMMNGMAMDLNDIAYDAFLANDRDLGDPEVVQVESGGRVRLRVINAASSTNFWLDLGALQGNLTAVDGMAIQPIAGRRFEIAMAQRLDIDATLPQGSLALPILAQREGDRARTGIVLASAGARVQRLDASAEATAPPVLLDLERRLAAGTPLAPRPVDRRIPCNLSGEMAPYVWGINGRVFDARQPLDVRAGERVEIDIMNHTMMSHPIHLHGHHFQVVGLGGLRMSGAIRDTVLVPPMERVTVAFDADNPGDWPLHCHNLYHMAAGMMTTLRYV